MAERFINIDRDAPMLLPVDLRDWIPEGHIVHYILDVIGTLDTSAFETNVVVSNHLTGSSSDRRELIPALEAAADNGYKVTTVLADNGYYSESNINLMRMIRLRSGTGTTPRQEQATALSPAAQPSC